MCDKDRDEKREICAFGASEDCRDNGVLDMFFFPKTVVSCFQKGFIICSKTLFCFFAFHFHIFAPNINSSCNFKFNLSNYGTVFIETALFFSFYFLVLFQNGQENQIRQTTEALGRTSTKKN